MAVKVTFNDGNLEFAMNDLDLARIIGERLGYEAGQAVAELANRADYNQYKLESDLRSYESSLEEATEEFRELSELVGKLHDELDKSRLDRKSLSALCDRMDTIISRNI